MSQNLDRIKEKIDLIKKDKDKKIKTQMFAHLKILNDQM